MSSGTHLDQVRGANDAAILTHARRGEPVSRLELADALHVTPQAISKMIARLVADGLIAESGTVVTGPGKPTTLYRLVATAKRAIGVQVARDVVRAAVVDLGGGVGDTVEHPLGEGVSAAQMLELVVSAAEELRGSGDGDLVGVGVGLPGPVAHLDGIFRGVDPEDPWRDLDVRTPVAERLGGLPVLVDNDSSAAAVGETWADPASMRNTAVVLVEHGIGAGVRLDGVLLRGAFTHAGEVGHTVCVLDGQQCACGRRGCAEAEHAAAHAAGDVERAARILASVVVDLVHLVDVDRIVLGGRRIYAHHAAYMDAAREALATQLPRAEWRHVEVLLSPHGDDVIAVGAGAAVLDHEYGLPGGLTGRR
ncbi:MAG: ROK family transcriptional regulator [Micrococcus sp.]|nr:ROK family transcriptional regulator [Micrococcus sp.]